jgi:shikimate dehydrogenase
MTVRLGVLGWPVAHSRSPAIQNAALHALGLKDWHYQRLPVPPELFEETVRALHGSGYLGANVTIPHKEAALAVSSQASAAAREIGAANTLTFSEGGGIAAENTDAPGLIDALGVPVAGVSAVVLGAGGSARAAVWALLRGGAREVSVYNRTAERARLLAEELGARQVDAPGPAELLVNCTSVGLSITRDPGSKTPEEAGKVERSATEDCALNQLGLTLDLLGEYSHVADLVYRTGSTPLLAAATRLGARTVDGLEILVAQGARSLALWTGRESPLDVMRRAARAEG